MLVTNKHFVPVIGLDIHIVILFGFPIPLPHPYIGFVVDPMDYIPFLGATTKVNHVPRGVSDTSGYIIIFIHFPMGGPWLLAPLIGHDSVNFYGSKTVSAEGRLLSPSGHMLMTCNDIGIPLSLQPGKKLKPLPSMYLPTSYSIPLSFGKPVNVGGPYVPDWAGVVMNLVASFGFGALMKGLGHALKKFNHLLQKKIGTNKLSDMLCKMGLEPVDLIQGIVVYNGTDFELPGPVPIQWKRSWYSDSPHKGLLGHGTHLSYDMRIQEFPAEGVTAVLLSDGRTAIFDVLQQGEHGYNRHEKLTLTRTDIDEYQLFHQKEKRYYTFRKPHPQAPSYLLSSIHNKAGFIVTLHYNQQGQLLRIIDSVGRHLRITSDKAGRITRVTAIHREQERILISYTYNDTGDLSAITDALQQTVHIDYQDHLMIRKTDRNGQTFYWEYDKQQRCIHTWGDGGIMEGFISYHPEKGYNEVTDSLEQTTTYYYTPDFTVTQVKDPLGHSSFIEYTPNMEIYRTIDAEGNMTGYEYDERGNRTAVIKPDGASSVFSYNDDGDMIVYTDAQGNSTAYVYYEGDGLLHTITEADGSMQIISYNEHKLISNIDNGRGIVTRINYDQDHNLAAIISSDGSVSSWEYDAWGQCTHVINPLRQQQTYRYDPLGRVTDVMVADGNHIRFEYNAYEEILRVTDKHHDVRFTYTPLGSIRTREENGAKQHFIYNTAEQLTTLINEHGESYRFKRNGRGDLIQETGFDGITRYYDRDAAGKVIAVKRPGGKSTLYEYDYNGALTRCEHSDGTWETYSYDRNGLLIAAVNEHTTVRLERDQRGNVISEWQNGHIVNKSYHRNHRQSKVESSLGAQIQYELNSAGQLSGIQASGIDSLNPWTTQIQYNLLGLEIERTLPGGIKSSWTYDDTGLPATHTIHRHQHTARNRYYRWDANQRLKEIVNAMEKGTVKFSHDAIGHLAWAQYENGQYDYRMPDKAGHIYRTADRKDRKYNAGGQLAATSEARFTYDAEGNLIKKINKDLSTWTYEWYDSGTLKKVIRPDNRPITFEYDALGRRTAKIFKQQVTRWVWNGNAPLHEWTYDAAKRPVITIDELGNIQMPPEPVPAETLATWVFEEESLVPVAKIINGKHYSIINDHMGTPCEAYDEAGEKIWACELDIYGKLRKLTGDKTFIPFRYMGQYEDVETGLYYNRFRYYSPEEGVYISQDPKRVRGGSRLYGYVNDTNLYVDRYGLNSECPVITNKFPEEELPKEGKIIPFTIEDGKIKGVGGRREFDFVIDTNGNLIIGNKHHTLGNRSDVLAAGQMKLTGKGQVRRIDNLSGHYRPTPEEALNTPKLLQDAGLNVDGATHEAYRMTIDADGNVINVEKAYTKVINQNP